MALIILKNMALLRYDKYDPSSVEQIWPSPFGKHMALLRYGEYGHYQLIGLISEMIS